MKYLILLIVFVLSSCGYDNQVNSGWVIYDLEPMNTGYVMYYGEDDDIGKGKVGRVIKFIGHEGEYNIGDSVKIVKVKQHGR